MKPLAFLAALLALTLVIVGCKTDIPSQSSETESVSDSNETSVSENISDIETVSAPLFEVSKFSDIDTPEVIDDITFRAPAFTEAGFESYHSVRTPKIDSDKPGAVALNEKMNIIDREMVSSLEAGGVSDTAKIVYYFSSSYGGMISIQKIYKKNIKGANYTHACKYYYYDSINDCEISEDEYLAHFGLDKDMLKFRSRWDVNYLDDISMYSNLVYSASFLSENSSDYKKEIIRDSISYGYSQESRIPSGFQVSKSDVTIFYESDNIDPHWNAPSIKVTDGMPSYPIVFYNSKVTGELTDRRGLDIDIEDKNIKHILASKDIPVSDVTVFNGGVTVTYKVIDNNTDVYDRSFSSFWGVVGENYSQEFFEQNGEKYVKHTYQKPYADSSMNDAYIAIVFPDYITNSTENITESDYYDFILSLIHLNFCTFYDITGDGIPELITNIGTSEASKWYIVYTIIDGKVTEIGRIGASHCWSMGVDQNGLIVFGAHMGYEWAFRIVYENGNIFYTCIYEREITEEDTEFDDIETSSVNLYSRSDIESMKERYSASAPLFDVSKFSDIDTPAVVDAINFEKTDIFDGGAYEFTHKIVLPQIDSTLPGAVALNNKMAGSDTKLAERLANMGEPSRNLYRISYDYSAYDGIIAIQKTNFTGLYQSEGASSSEHYYYDSVNDKELTADEYLAHFGLDADDLNFRARWCSNYLWAEDKYYGGVVYCDTLLCRDEAKYSEVMPENGLVYGFAKEANTPCGYKITEDAVTVYYTVHGYTSYADECVILVENGLPENPLFYVQCVPTDILNNKNGIEIKLENGKIKSAKTSKDIEIAGSVTITNDCITVVYPLDFDTDNSYAAVNDSITSVGYGQALILEENDEYEKFVHTYYLPKEVRLNEYKTMEIIFE